MDNTTIHPSCTSLAHLVDLHLWRGPPQNLDADRPVQILVNQGYVVGFSPQRLQPAWSAYRVADADRDVDYKRPLFYYQDMRLEEKYRIGRHTFGKLGGIQLNVGHMSPNEVINRQFGRLAQMETFLMSNMSPQYGSLNSGVWLKLETAIRLINDDPDRDHVWVISGPVFGDAPSSINRGNGKNLPVPDSYFCVVVDPHTYPYDIPSKVNIDCFIIPQTAPRSSSPDDYPATLEEVEAATSLRFFASWGRDLPFAMMSTMHDRAAPVQSRLMRTLQEVKSQRDVTFASVDPALPEADTIGGLIDALKAEAAQLEIQQRALTEEELARVNTIQHTISWLLRAREVAGPPVPAPEPANMITYKVIEDLGDKLTTGARSACNFWNRFVTPKYSIVIRLGTFTQFGNTIARAYMPYDKDGVHYGKVEFNTRFLGRFTDDEIAGTIIHEIGHTLGIGWDTWRKLFHENTGRFKSTAVSKLRSLELMEVELDGGPGTALSHWDEDRFDRELMTGYQDAGEYVLPVTIDVMEILGHKINERLPVRKPLKELLEDAARVVFSRQDEARQLDLEYYKETDLFETIPHVTPAPKDPAG
ncbi:DNA/RNA non-specific endonuclease [Roseibium sp.]|uniref:DNA/RNA non-specific endonuclease n=1 Tax=Roseibium sp. TaxID=1936156 RepID=UPI003D0976DE